ncbi:dihydrolipoyl dehydrogenase family protein [Rubrobacter aplysinae]|uniref:dihydrolipoyl dehydrogenase family protein n=1 Tax=Rubrobacter aplysinae TaxID=909625 RepID=UPI00064BDF99|nr:FAD-dependent oxidoreductase [Rubrobacter aplysinae]
MSDYDLLVVGGGTAGLVAAAGGASLGARVALVERDRLGGDCLYRGCVPTKALVKSAKVASLARRAEEFGLRPMDVEVDFPAVMRRMRSVIQKAGEPDDPERFRELGVELYLGEEARFTGPKELAVGGRRLGGRGVVLATGSHAKAPPVEGLAEAGYLDNERLLALERMPGSMVIIGSGPIGCEFAQMFARFGCRVELVSSSPEPLPKEEPEVSATLRRSLEKDGVRFHGGYRAESVRVEGGEKVVTARGKDGSTAGKIEARGEEILVSAGRAPTVDGLGLENAGVEVGERGVTVDEHLMTTAEGVYATGDVTGRMLFTHAAEHQSRTVISNALFPVKRKIDHSAVPWTTFTDPEVARVGLTESEAREKHGHAESFRHDFAELDRALCDGETEGFAKLVTGRGGRLLGAHIIGPDSGNYVAESVLALRKGMKIGDLSQTVHVYPTLAEITKKAADNYYREKFFTRRNQKILGALFSLRRRLF